MKKNEIYEKVIDFKRRYPISISWRVREHSKVANKLINKDEKILYAFAAQKSPTSFNIFSTFVIVLTDKRIVLAQKRLIYGYFYYSITPDMFNDLTISMGLLWGKAIIDTVREQVYLSSLSRKAMEEIETVLSKYMIQKKRELELGDTEELVKVREMEEELKKISKNGEK